MGRRINQLQFLLAAVALLAAVSLAAGCQAKLPTLRLATTTTTVDSGLMDELLPLFEEKYQVNVRVIAVGTGEALELGRAGDVDVVLVHARPAEDAFVAAGYGLPRRDVMFNDFVLLGPEPDPASIQGMTDAAAAMAIISEAGAPFISRGDQSGTHLRELELWQAAGVEPNGSWYHSIGQGMGSALTFAEEKEAYTLSDRGTYIARKVEGLDLVILVEGDARLLNLYGVIAVNPANHESVEADLAQQFVEWVTSPEAQQAIARYRINGEQLFFGNATGGR